ncbi:MAG TPA: endolytic transglycosylase MltG [Gammaproteobacteria bacterium]|nr:endolytic transglycosylase MltG [Gammaproteobacteria bacterium]
MRILSLLFKTLFTVFFVLAGIFAYTLYAPIPLPKEGTIFYVRPGISRENLVAELSQNHLIRLSPIFGWYTHMRGATPRSGEYQIQKGSSPLSIWRQFTRGTGRYYRSFTIIPGWTFKQVKTAMLNTNTMKHVVPAMTDENLMMVLGDSEHKPEGMFLPETYYYSRGDSDLSILKRAYDLMMTKLNEAWQTRAADLPYQTPYQVLIAASLIEKEAFLPKEQPVIGGVLVNRLRKDMLLQFDPTVIYGMGDSYQGKIHKTDLTTDTPYNTYIHKGLTPTPIAMPGWTAVVAALHPEVNQYYYFVAKGDGSHEFTSNLKAHESAVKNAAELHAKQAENSVSASGDSHAVR